ncbi:hypothetical protein [Lentzea sp. NPDC059081]
MMTLSANDLFSHVETHQPQAPAASARPDQASWTNLFQEPPPAPEVSAE